MATLVRPSEKYRESYLEALREAHAEGRLLRYDLEQLSADFGGFVREFLDKEDRSKLQPGKVLESIYWLIEGDTYVGRLSLRHELNDYLRQIGGHIGYDIRPSYRGQGYGKLILKLGLERARDLGLSRVLLTCDSDHVASRKIIEYNGGVLEDEIEVEEQPVTVLRYWIAL